MLPRWKFVAVPKISIDKNGQFSLSENHIRSARQFSEVLAEPEAPLVKFRTHAGLRFCILPFDTGHAITSLLRSQVVWHFLMVAETD